VVDKLTNDSSINLTFIKNAVASQQISLKINVEDFEAFFKNYEEKEQFIVSKEEFYQIVNAFEEQILFQAGIQAGSQIEYFEYSNEDIEEGNKSLEQNKVLDEESKAQIQ